MQGSRLFQNAAEKAQIGYFSNPEYTYRLYKHLFMHPNNPFIVCKALKKLFSVALLLWRACMFIVSKSGPFTVRICLNQVHALTKHCVAKCVVSSQG